jgi:hypothetical protein
MMPLTTSEMHHKSKHAARNISDIAEYKSAIYLAGLASLDVSGALDRIIVPDF